MSRWLQTRVEDGGYAVAPRRAIVACSPILGEQQVHVILRWLRASVYVRNQQLAHDACIAFGEVLTGSKQDGDALFEACERVDREAIRRARVRLDFVACILLRRFFATMNLRETWLHIFADGSPQWRGTEVFACSLDLSTSGYRERMLLPLVTLQRTRLDARSKAFCLLFQFFLLVGPSYSSLRAFCGKVVSITN